VPPLSSPASARLLQILLNSVDEIWVSSEEETYGGGMFMKKFCILIMAVWLLSSCATMKSANYEETVAQWTSYRDVAEWMKANFYYDQDKQRRILGMRPHPMTPAQTFKSKSGICYDAAVLARDALNRINQSYDAKIVFIENAFGPPNHWATAFTLEGKLYILDYGASNSWGSMNGLHGPYDSLKDYEKFLSSLKISRFQFGALKYTEAFDPKGVLINNMYKLNETTD
jgi:hypothetical protein